MGIRTVELFAGVGGFRLGLERSSLPYETVWWNQWEPGAQVQHAWQCYADRFHAGELVNPLTNQDIGKVPSSRIPQHDLLVGGFPCQDYSVATTLDKAGGLHGKKGVLWWEINRILGHRKPPYVLLENVDRLLKSPAAQRGRDFGVVLACLRDLGYAVEWRVLNAADFGQAQRRRRTFIFAAQRGTGIGKAMAKAASTSTYLQTIGFFAEEFPTSYEAIEVEALEPVTMPDTVQEVSDSFEFRFQNAGVMTDGQFWTQHVTPNREPQAVLSKHLERHGVAPEYQLDTKRLKDWQYQKGAKNIPRTAKNGHEYRYTEGGMQFPDLWTAPARTILTSEANRTPNRSTHVIEDPETRKLRFLTPLEVERLMGFDDGWTERLPERWRYFTMGNALVVPLVTRMGRRLGDWISRYEPDRTVERLLQTNGPIRSTALLAE